MTTHRRHIVLRAEPGVINVTPWGFHRYASQFLRTARLVRSHAIRKFSPVPYYLYCHGIELILKAFLLTQGVAKSDLPKPTLRHDLDKILARCKRHGLNAFVKIDVRQEDAIKKANAYYVAKGFEYFEIRNAARGYRDLPHLDDLDAVCTMLVRDLEAQCRNA